MPAPVGSPSKSGFTTTAGRITKVGGGAVVASTDASFSASGTSLTSSTAQAALGELGGRATMADLRAIAPSNGKKAVTNCFATAGDGGGGTWRGVTGASPGTYTHNGGSVIVPSGGDGSTAWLRDFSDSICPEWFGAKADDSTDDTTAIAAALALAGAVYAATGSPARVLFQPRIYRHTGLEVTDFGVYLDGKGATLKRTADNEGLLVSMSWTAIQDISAISSQAIDLAGDATGNTTVSRLTVSSAAAYSVGDWVRVVSDDIHSSVASGNEREGEFGRVSSVNTGSNYVYLSSVLEFAANYVTAPRLAKMTSAPKVTIDGIAFDYAVVSSSSKEEIKIIGAFAPELIDVTIKRSLGVGIKLNGTLRARTENLLIDSVSTAVGYGLIECSAELSEHANLRGSKCRHVWTTGVSSTSTGSTAIQDFGRTKYAKISGFEAWHCWKEGLDTHPDAYHCRFENVLVRDSWIGPAGGDRAINIEGIGNTIVNAETIGMTGLSFNNTQSGLADGCRDNVAIGCRHTFKAPATGAHWAFGVLSTDTLAKGNRFVDCSVNVNGTLGIPFLTSTYGEAIIVNPYVRWDAPSGTANVFKLNGNAVCRVRGGTIDCTGAASTALRPFTISSNGSSLYVNGARIVTGGTTINRLIEMSSSDSNAWLDVIVDGTISALVNGIGSGTMWIRSGASEAPNSLGSTRSYTIASGAITVITPRATIDTESSAASDDLDTINGGAEGDILVVGSANSGRDPTLKSGTGNLKLASDFTLATSNHRMMLIKVGSNWHEISRAANT